MKKTKQANKFTFDFDLMQVTRNNRKFGDILSQSETEIIVRITTKQHQGTGELMTFKIVANESENKD
jgi:Cdc6-like AAA superfamily ATPase